MFHDETFRYNIFEGILPFNNYQFVVQSCNALGCSNVSSPSPTAMTLPDSKWISYTLQLGRGREGGEVGTCCEVMHY